MSSGRQRQTPIAEKLKEIGSWVKETIIITVNEIADAVMDDIPDDLVDHMLPEESPESPSESSQTLQTEFDYCGRRVYSSSDTGSTQSCDFDEPDYDFPTTLNRASIISRINTLYASGFGLGSTILNENRKLISKSSQDNDDIVLVVNETTPQDMDEPDWIKL
jgi:hypothetical protein